MDRFLVHVKVPYPPAENELSILRLVRSETVGSSSQPQEPIRQETVFAARTEVNAVHVAEAAERYIVDLVIASREPERYGEDLAKWTRIGASPRATIALDAASRALGCTATISSRRKTSRRSPRRASPTVCICRTKPRPPERRVKMWWTRSWNESR